MARLTDWLGSILFFVALVEFVPNPKKAIDSIYGCRSYLLSSISLRPRQLQCIRASTSLFFVPSERHKLPKNAQRRKKTVWKL